MKNIEKYLELNQFLDKHLNIKLIKEQHKRDILFKIVDMVMYRYKINFNDKNWFNNIEYIDYINNLVDFIDKYIYDTDKDFDLDVLLSLHANIMWKLTTTEKINHKNIWTLRPTTKYISAHWIDWKIERRWFTSPKFLKKEVKATIEDLNIWLKSNNRALQVEKIIWFVLYNLFITHPFDNWNDKTFFILLDILLLKYNFFPWFFKKSNHREMILKTFSKYTPEHNYQKLKENFINDMINIYKNYQM